MRPSLRRENPKIEPIWNRTCEPSSSSLENSKRLLGRLQARTGPREASPEAPPRQQPTTTSQPLPQPMQQSISGNIGALQLSSQTRLQLARRETATTWRLQR